MNEQLQQALASLLNKTVSGVEAGAAFLQTEIPDVIYQLLIWKAAVSAISMLGFFLLAYTIYKINAMQYKWYKSVEYFEMIDHPQLLVNIFQIFWFIPLCVLWSIDWLQIWIAPKIYLIEYAASLAK